jgi:hypothetical protein
VPAHGNHDTQAAGPHRCWSQTGRVSGRYKCNPHAQPAALGLRSSRPFVMPNVSKCNPLAAVPQHWQAATVHTMGPPHVSVAGPLDLVKPACCFGLIPGGGGARVLCASTSGFFEAPVLSWCTAAVYKHERITKCCQGVVESTRSYNVNNNYYSSPKGPCRLVIAAHYMYHLQLLSIESTCSD